MAHGRRKHSLVARRHAAATDAGLRPLRGRPVRDGMPAEEREEGNFLLYDAEKVQQDPNSDAVLRKLEEIYRTNDLATLKTAVDASGEHL